MCSTQLDSGLKHGPKRRGTPICRYVCALGRRGFTLIEMMVVISILAILAAVTVPNLSSFVSSSAVSGAQSELVSALALARNEAGRLGAPVFVTAINPITGNEFGGGWRVWRDLNASADYTSGQTPDELIRQFDVPRAGVVMRTVSAGSQFTFQPSGFLASSQATSITICSAKSNKKYTVVLQAVGMPDVSEASSSTCP